MKFKGRKVYQNGGNKNVFLMQIPRLICDDMGLTKDSIIDIDYDNGEMKVTKQEPVECQEKDAE